MVIYLDENCFQRGFDDQTQARIRMEAIACQEILIQAETGKIDLVWSFMHMDETLQCPFPERKLAVIRLSDICRIRVGPSENIYTSSIRLQQKLALSPKMPCTSHAPYQFRPTYFLHVMIEY